MAFVVFLMLLLVVLARVVVAVDERSIRAHHDEATRSRIDFAILASTIFVVWLATALLL